jgi:hypothetical protein
MGFLSIFWKAVKKFSQNHRQQSWSFQPLADTRAIGSCSLHFVAFAFFIIGITVATKINELHLSPN